MFGENFFWSSTKFLTEKATYFFPSPAIDRKMQQISGEAFPLAQTSSYAIAKSLVN